MEHHCGQGTQIGACTERPIMWKKQQKHRNTAQVVNTLLVSMIMSIPLAEHSKYTYYVFNSSLTELYIFPSEMYRVRALMKLTH